MSNLPEDTTELTPPDPDRGSSTKRAFKLISFSALAILLSIGICSAGMGLEKYQFASAFVGVGMIIFWFSLLSLIIGVIWLAIAAAFE